MCVRVVFVGLLLSVFFFFKQKTAYEMRISDWSSDVCSSDLVLQDAHALDLARDTPATAMARMQQLDRDALHVLDDGRLAGIVTYRGLARLARSEERREGKSVSVRVDLGGCRIIKKKNNNKHHDNRRDTNQ